MSGVGEFILVLCSCIWQADGRRPTLRTEMAGDKTETSNNVLISDEVYAHMETDTLDCVTECLFIWWQQWAVTHYAIN
jgi:hypothetical protein